MSSLDLIDSLETKFFSDEINLEFVMDDSFDSDDHHVQFNKLNNDSMLSFQHEFGDTGVSSDGGCNSSDGCMDFGSTFDGNDFTNFSSINQYINLQDEDESEIKLEPNSPLEQSPQCLSPLNSSFNPVLEIKPELLLETPPISPPHQMTTDQLKQTTTSGKEIVQVITLNPNGGFQFQNSLKLVQNTSSNNLSFTATQNMPKAIRGPIIQPKPIPANSVVIKVLPTDLSTLNVVSDNKQFGAKTSHERAANFDETSGKHAGNVDVRALKRQQRMIKNRESACLSRKKKKEYVSALESTLSELNRENQKLKQENALLREKVSLLEGRETNNKSLIGSLPKKNTALFAILLVVSFNVFALGNFFVKQRELFNPLASNLDFGSKPSIAAVHAGGRSLLWSSEKEDNFVDSGNGNISLAMCPMQINRTESSRIDSELRGWFATPSQSKISPVKPPAKTSSKQELAKVMPRPTAISSTAYRKYLLAPQNRVSHTGWITKNEIQLYESVTDRHLFAAFFEAIQRKDDTFYVVSFSGDHLLLPATLHNSTLRPRMSLLLPAIPFNSTMQPGHIGMMQIDCEVTNTKLLYVSENSIPPYKHEGNRTADRKYEQDSAAKRPWRRANKKNAQKFNNADAVQKQQK